MTSSSYEQLKPQIQEHDITDIIKEYFLDPNSIHSISDDIENFKSLRESLLSYESESGVAVTGALESEHAIEEKIKLLVIELFEEQSEGVQQELRTVLNQNRRSKLQK